MRCIRRKHCEASKCWSVENCSKQFTICILGNGEEIERGSFYFMKSMHVYLQIRNT